MKKLVEKLGGKKHVSQKPVSEPPMVSQPEVGLFDAAKKRVLEANERSKSRQSVLFFTTHKCASTFVSVLLDELAGQSDYETYNFASAYWELGDQVDSAGVHIRKFLPDNYDVLFRVYGEIYGPLRFPVEFPGRENFKHLFFFRDPRDVLVSSYYSWAFTHPEPLNSKARERFLDQREKLAVEGIDAYVLRRAQEWIVPMFTEYQELAESVPDALILSYNEFSQETDVFLRKVADYLKIELSAESLEKLANFASPIREGAPKLEHKRSGKSGQWKNELKPETADELNRILKPIVDYWGF